MNTPKYYDNRSLDAEVKMLEDRIAALKGEVVRLKAELDAAHAAIYQALQNL